jgi:hypothetical protein
MTMRPRSMVLAVAALCLNACSTAPTERSLAQDAVTAMGGKEKLQAIQTITMNDGTGTRMRLGQLKKVGDTEPGGTLKKVVETVDITGGRASLDYELTNGDFTQHRHEILTRRGDQPVGIEIVGTRPIVATSPGGLFSWGTQNSPEFLLRRNVVSVVLAAADSASDAQPAQDKTFNGKMAKYAAVKASPFPITSPFAKAARTIQTCSSRRS